MVIDRIVALAKTKAIQPLDVSKLLGVDLLIAGAHLSTLVSKSILKTSFLKLGSSPVYYLPGFERYLLDFVYALNEKDRETVSILKDKKVLRYSDEPALTRVSLKNIRDFAKPLEVTIDGNKEIFFKWFLTDDSEVRSIIENLLSKKSSDGSILKKEEGVEKVKSSTDDNSIKDEVVNVLKKEEVSSKKKEDEIKKQESAIKKGDVSPLKNDTGSKISKKSIVSSEIRSFFEKNKINLLNVLDEKKNFKEYLVNMPTPLGSVKFYCVFLDKSRVGDADISKVVVNSQIKKLPGMLIHSGNLTSKAEELSKKMSEIIVKRLV